MNELNFNQLQSKWEQRRLEAKKRTLNKVKSIFQDLKRQGVEEIIISYSGSGDSGQVNDVQTSPVEIDISTGEFCSIEDFAYEHLPPGFEINDGSEGTLTVDLDECTVDFNHYWLQPTYDESLDTVEFSLEEE